MSGRVLYIISLLLISLSFFSCNPARRLPEGDYLLNRNRIEIEEASVNRNELSGYFRQVPNRRLLGFYRFHLHVYQLAGRGSENRLKRWMKNTIGEPPVLYDATLSQITAGQFEMYLQSKGYFNAEVEFEENLKKSRKATITYIVRGNEPYTIRRLDYNIADPNVRRFIFADTVETYIRPGDRYDAANLHNERNRIARNLRNEGFYRFSRDFIFFQVDSNLNNNQVNVELQISNPVVSVPGTRDSVVEKRHRIYTIDDVVILPEYSPLTAGIAREDTTIYEAKDRRREQTYDYTFLHNGPLRIKPPVIVNHLMLRPGNHFSIRHVEQSYSFLSELRNFRLINLQFSEVEDPAHGHPSDTVGFLRSTIQLSRSAANAFTIEAEGLNTAGNLGVASNILYQNRNIFRGAEIFNLRLKVAAEVAGETTGAEEVFQRLPFNTLELGLEGGVDFPKLLFPISVERLSRNSRPKSTIVAGVNFRQRPDYTRYILNLSYGFEWRETSRKRHSINPLEVSSVRVYNDSILRANIPDANPLILSRFRDHFILGLKYTYVYNTQQPGREVDFMYLRTNFESAGNLLNLMAGNFEWEKDEQNSYNVFNIPFSQFLKVDADYRYYRVFDERQVLVLRAMAGIGVPYGNVDVLPFIKSYYGGGANGLRAWPIYGLGPGGYSSDDQEIRFDRYGDIKLETNIEYRFRIYGFWHGAFFMDAGNVWFVRENQQFPGGEFTFSDLGKDLAIGSGLGLRLDFDFFVIRVDAAFPVKNPGLANHDQWIQSFPAFKDFNFNLGIGYPF